MSKTKRKKLDTFFTITPPSGKTALQFAQRYWDTYGFDYDMQKCGATVLAWATESDDELKAALDEAGIKYETFQADAEQLFK